MVPSREYIQPQWVFDCLNTSAILPVEPYRPGIQPPPHLSPWTDSTKENYRPRQAAVLAKWAAGQKQEFDDFVDDDQSSESDDESSSDEEEVYARELVQESAAVSAAPPAADNAGDSSDSSGDDENETPTKEVKEPTPPPPMKESKRKRKKKNKKRKRDDAKPSALAVSMMTGKDKRLYDHIQKGIAKTKSQVNKLKAKRRKLAKS